MILYSCDIMQNGWIAELSTIKKKGIYSTYNKIVFPLVKVLVKLCTISTPNTCAI